MTRKDQEENDEESKLDFPQRRLSRLDLDLVSRGNCRAYVDWFLGPRSCFEAHIRTLRVDHLQHDDEEALNRLLRTIGRSLEHLEFHVPIQTDRGSEYPPILNPSRISNFIGLALPEPMFNIKLEFNSNIRFLRLTNIHMLKSGVVSPKSFGLIWLLRFLSNIDTSNKLEQIQLEAIIGFDYRQACTASSWEQVDRLLAGKFRKLQKLDIKLWSTTGERDDSFAYSEIRQCMLDAHPLLVERGVSVDVRGEWWGLDEDIDLF
jgi:hypothetical protein